MLFLALIVIVILSGYLSNAWDDVAGDTTLESTANQYGMSGWLLDNYIIVTLVFGFVDLLVLVMVNTYVGGDV